MKKLEAKHIVDYLKENQESMIFFLKELVEAESPSTDVNAQVKIINLLRSALEELDFHVIQIPGKKTGGFILGMTKSSALSFFTFKMIELFRFNDLH